MSPRTTYTTGVVQLQLMPVSEIITDIGRRVELEIRRVFLVGISGIRVLYVTVGILITRLQMTHVILTAQTDLNGQFVPKPITVRDIKRMVLCQAVEVGVIVKQLLHMRTVC